MKNSFQESAFSFQEFYEQRLEFIRIFLKAESWKLEATSRDMTLIETLVAITILTVAIMAPMSLTMQSLSASYYARDQIAAFNIGQEAIESVRAIRDGNILRIAYDQPDPECDPMDLLCQIPVGTPFVIDTRNNSITLCPGDCPPLQTDGNLYGYEAGWGDTRYTRSVSVSYVDEATKQEIRVRVDVVWVAGPLQTRTFTIYENLYRWVNDGSV